MFRLQDASQSDRFALTMKIAAVRPLVVHAVMRNWVFVKVETDQSGLWGWGEASLEWKTRSVVGAVQDLEPMIMGEDPTRIEHLGSGSQTEPLPNSAQRFDRR
jgi:L-alanine-DL-glutamate epimerase-like enolase superfamily enzyme